MLAVTGYPTETAFYVLYHLNMSHLGQKTLKIPSHMRPKAYRQRHYFESLFIKCWYKVLHMFEGQILWKKQIFVSKFIKMFYYTVKDYTKAYPSPSWLKFVHSVFSRVHTSWWKSPPVYVYYTSYHFSATHFPVGIQQSLCFGSHFCVVC